MKATKIIMTNMKTIIAKMRKTTILVSKKIETKYFSLKVVRLMKKHSKDIGI